MSRAPMAATLLACLTLVAGCSGPGAAGSGSDGSGSGTTAAALTATAAGPTEDSSPLAGMSALEVWEKTKADADAAQSVHVAARFLDGKDKVAINLKMTDAGKVFGLLVLNGDRVRIRRLGSTLYFKADYEFWLRNADAATGQALGDKWIMVKQGFSADLDQFFELTDMDALVADTMSLSATGQQKLKLVPGIQVGTRSTVGLSDESTENTEEAQTLYVAASDPALPLNLTMSADDSQYMKFREWNKSFNVVAPRGAIDLAKKG